VCARRERNLAEEHPEQGGLAGAVPTGDRETFPGGQVDIDRPETKVSALGDRAVEAQDVVREPPTGPKGEPQLPRLERLLRQLVALEKSLRLADLRLERMRRAPVRAARLVAERIALRARLRATRAQELGESSPPQLRLVELRHGRSALGVTCDLVVRPPARPLAGATRSRVDRDHAVDRPVEQLAIVRDEHERAAVRLEEALEAAESVEVEVVRRLVEQKDVEPGQEDRREPDPSGLAARKALARPPEVEREPELGTDASRASVEVAASERQIAVERGRVAILRGLAARESRCGVLELPLRPADPCSTPERVEDRLAELGATLLLEVADRHGSGRARHGSPVRSLGTRHDSQQGRLADPVRADQTDPGAWPDRQGDVVEDDLSAIALRDVRELNSHRRTS
jgi:hypothetical protein